MAFPESLLRPGTPSQISEDSIHYYWDSLLNPRSSEELLRQKFFPHLPKNKPLSLWSLSDDDAPAGRYQKQALTIIDLIILTIWGSQNKRLTYAQICQAIENRWPALETRKDKPWTSTIRHSLTRKAVFVRIARADGDPGSGGYWAIDARRGPGDTRDRVRGGGGTRKLSKTSSSESSDSFQSDTSSSQYSYAGSSESSVELHQPYESHPPSVHGYPSKMATYSPTAPLISFSPPPRHPGAQPKRYRNTPY